MQTAWILSSLPLTALITIVIGKPAIRMLHQLKFGQHIREEGPQSHLAKGGTPTMGGLFFLLPIMLVTFFFSKPNWHTFSLLLVVAGVAALGFIDDYQKIWLRNNKGITPKQKLAGQLTVGLLLSLYVLFGPPQHNPYTHIPFVGLSLPLSWLFIPFTLFFFTATTNAVNLTDGLDGLATSVSAICVAGLTLLLALYGGLEDPRNVTLIILGLSTIGGCLGFLWFNAHPAQVFMGDTGSLGLGGIIAVLAILGHLELWFVIIGLIFVAEAFSVVLQVAYFKRTRKRLFRMSPLHHHYELGGWKETQIVSRFSIVSVMLTVTAVVSAYYLGPHP
jgi:phospho-N-acetylmuramoyl-pentapeptide-transferase